MRILPLLLVSLCAGCTSESDTPKSPNASQDELGLIVSFLGERLVPVDLPEEVRTDFQAKLNAAQAVFDANPGDVEATIWLGRRQAYLGRYQEAIETFTRGVARHPDEPRLHRHRGHRYITTRALDRAIADLEKAAELIAGTPDEIEPDGLPNAAGIPTGTLQSNIWYHLGLARYLGGDFLGAQSAYEECLAVSENPDMLVATSHWLYMTLRRLGLESQAAELLEPITVDMEILENREYHQLLLMYREEIALEEIWPPADNGITSATLGYGVGNWYLYRGRTTKAEEMFQQIVEGDQWAAFGFLAAEAEIARSQELRQP